MQKGERALQYFTRRSHPKYGTMEYDKQRYRMVTDRGKYIKIISKEEQNIILGLGMEEIRIQLQKGNEEKVIIKTRRLGEMGRFATNIYDHASAPTIVTLGDAVRALGNHRREEGRAVRGVINPEINCVGVSSTDIVTFGDSTMDTSISALESFINGINHNMEIMMIMIL